MVVSRFPGESVPVSSIARRRRDNSASCGAPGDGLAVWGVAIGHAPLRQPDCLHSGELVPIQQRDNCRSKLGHGNVARVDRCRQAVAWTWHSIRSTLFTDGHLSRFIGRTWGSASRGLGSVALGTPQPAVALTSLTVVLVLAVKLQGKLIGLAHG